ncbi:DUF4097 family beta strand repeat-containing protein [Stackebrandtia nassauensis]|uniref:DUF4097 domain-containing protein n=1 Tax=Stackebrandtia nassauensis (strain DSM 44728 / CIP 108903 / NRRL B-16338 / NBRC 102104 / LLR-40K-21) TaxID=446470 RepID=D3Q2J2_STANL|nr:DUF4097 family beta strand repeat-containing protein [Stackebrandtia nassauensis]ADD43925.1 hypothetical protein Snas_4276 [Stackebrandtia nassauensis DSM 44728]
MPEFACDGPISVNITLASGSCEVVAEDRANAVVTVTPHKNNSKSKEAAEKTSVDFRDNKLTVRAPDMTSWLLGGNAAIDVVVKVPVGSNVTTKSASASINYQGQLEVVSATTASGSITVEKATEASVNTASGDAHVIECVGAARGNTVSGDLQLDHVGGDVNAKSVSGDVRIGYAGGSLQGNSVSGDINVNSISTGHCRVKSVSGAVSIGIAPGTGVWMDVTSVSGNTSSDLAVGDMPAAAAANLELHVNTISGNIDLFRAQPV